MKKIFKIITILLSAMLIFTACDKIEDKPVSNSEVSEETEPENSEHDYSSAEETEPELPERDRNIDTNTVFVFDDAKILSAPDYDALNEYTAWISKTFKINAAVVTASDIGDKSAEEYAQEYYKDLYGSSDGIMFLINNDTGTDYLLRKGAPSHFISDSEIEMLFSEISPMLVTGSFKDAAARVMELAELSLPEFAIDRTGKMTKDEITAVNDILSGDDGSLSMIFTSDTGEKKISDYAEEQAEKYITDGENSAIMTVNTSSGEYYICSQGDFSDMEKNQSKIKNSVSACFTETDNKKSFNFTAAADIFVKFSGR